MKMKTRTRTRTTTMMTTTTTTTTYVTTTIVLVLTYLYMDTNTMDRISGLWTVLGGIRRGSGRSPVRRGGNDLIAQWCSQS
ncbi:hypothetical protein K0M31_011974 [Melipona bicolor]|uniref:Uncharacterized protein n=1 Tax=Melipona bicolor TaxID=60889 RepID=A0AA40GAT9_9HYME|nr:hypothetical protein K0M31_011974 [Melipona bicolor]